MFLSMRRLYTSSLSDTVFHVVVPFASVLGIRRVYTAPLVLGFMYHEYEIIRKSGTFPDVGVLEIEDYFKNVDRD